MVSRLQDDPDHRNHIHLVWYVVQGPGARVTATDVELIRHVFPNVIVVITKNDITRPQQREAMSAELVRSGVTQSNIVPVSEGHHESLRALVALSMRLLPEAYRDAFCSAQSIDLGSKKVKAQVVIQSAAASAAIAGAIPIPFSDAIIITAIQFSMTAGLAVVYGLPAEAIRAAAAPLLAQVAGVMAASSLTKLFPGLGSLIQAGVAFTLTEVIGQLVDSWMIRCYEARIKGLPLPDFQLPLESLAQMVRTHKGK